MRAMRAEGFKGYGDLKQNLHGKLNSSSLDPPLPTNCRRDE
jgi:DNA-binding MurR/RpiR family transcriptional regulator